MHSKQDFYSKEEILAPILSISSSETNLIYHQDGRKSIQSIQLNVIKPLTYRNCQINLMEVLNIMRMKRFRLLTTPGTYR